MPGTILLLANHVDLGLYIQSTRLYQKRVGVEKGFSYRAPRNTRVSQRGLCGFISGVIRLAIHISQPNFNQSCSILISISTLQNA